MKKIKLIIFFVLFFVPIILFASEKQINMYLFYGDGCPHCAALEKYLNLYLKDKNNIKLYKYEVWYEKENAKKYSEVHKILNQGGDGIPYLIIGETSITGYDEKYTPERIENAINYYSNVKYRDKVGEYLGVVEKQNDENNEKIEKTEFIEENVDIPILGKKKINEVPLLLSAIIIGLVDGFNPCAMWILIFLISMLLGMKDK